MEADIRADLGDSIAGADFAHQAMPRLRFMRLGDKSARARAQPNRIGPIDHAFEAALGSERRKHKVVGGSGEPGGAIEAGRGAEL